MNEENEEKMASTHLKLQRYPFSFVPYLLLFHILI